MQDLINGLETYLGTSPFLAVAAAFGGGVLASLSPCVYPLIPVVSTYVCSKSLGERTRFKALMLSLVYVVGMALVYAGLGVLAALTGSLFGQISTNPLAHLAVGNIIIVLALHLLGVIPLPSLTTKGPLETKRKGLFGAFLIGAASGFIASPCTTPILAVLLAYAGTKQNVLLGGVLLLAFSLGLGLLLVVVGTFSGLLVTLPKPGKWMMGVKKLLGFLMLALGEYFLIKAGQLWL